MFINFVLVLTTMRNTCVLVAIIARIRDYLYNKYNIPIFVICNCYVNDGGILRLLANLFVYKNTNNKHRTRKNINYF